MQTYKQANIPTSRRIAGNPPKNRCHSRRIREESLQRIQMINSCWNQDKIAFDHLMRSISNQINAIEIRRMTELGRIFDTRLNESVVRLRSQRSTKKRQKAGAQRRGRRMQL